VIKQHILTPDLSNILSTLIDAQKRGERIKVITLHFIPYSAHPIGYLVITEDE
jgi:hypothetical protein